jgi:hypothetical protein
LALLRAGQAMLTTERRLRLLGVAFDAIMRATRDPKTPWMLGHEEPEGQVRAVEALASKLTAEQAQAALGRGLDAMRGTTDPYALRLLAQAVQALPVQLTAEQAQAALGAILNAMQRSSINPYEQEDLPEAVQALALKLVVEAQADMQHLARSGLGATGRGVMAIAWARVLEALLPPAPASGYAGAIVEVLKYPTTTLRNKHGSNSEPASATEYLLAKIHERFPDTRELQSDNLQDTLAWIAKSYPEIDLTSPPVRPAFLDEIVFSLSVPR